MKKKQIMRTLSLNKKTISNLSDLEMGVQRGGDLTDVGVKCLSVETYCPTGPCPAVTCTYCPSACPIYC